MDDGIDPINHQTEFEACQVYTADFRTKSKCKPALNAKAVCITDDTVLEGLKRKEVEKAEAEKEKEAKRIERERKKKIREEKRLAKEHKKIVREEKRLVEEQKKKQRAMSNGRKTRSRKNCTQERPIDDALAALCLSSSSSDEDSDSSQEDSGEDNTTCPKCGIRSGFVVMGVTCGSTQM